MATGHRCAGGINDWLAPNPAIATRVAIVCACLSLYASASGFVGAAALVSIHSVREQHCNGHRADSSRNWRDGAGAPGQNTRLIVDIANKTIPAAQERETDVVLLRIGYPVSRHTLQQHN